MRRPSHVDPVAPSLRACCRSRRRQLCLVAVILVAQAKVLIAEPELDDRCRAWQDAFARDGFVKPDVELDDHALSGLWAAVAKQTKAPPSWGVEDFLRDAKGELFRIGAADEEAKSSRTAQRTAGPYAFTTLAAPDGNESWPLEPEALAELLPVLDSPAFRGALRCILPNAERLRLLTYVVMKANLPGDHPTGWHQDAFIYWGNSIPESVGGIVDFSLLDAFEAHSVAAFVGVGPVHEGMGHLMYQPGVHHERGFAGPHELQHFDGPPSYTEPVHPLLPFPDGPPPQAVPVGMGEFVLHSIYTPHFASTNNSPFVRWVMEMRFVDADWAEAAWRDAARDELRQHIDICQLGWPLHQELLSRELELETRKATLLEAYGPELESVSQYTALLFQALRKQKR